MDLLLKNSAVLDDPEIVGWKTESRSVHRIRDVGKLKGYRDTKSVARGHRFIRRALFYSDGRVN